MVEIFKGEEITSKQITTIKRIARERYSKEIYNEYFRKIKDVKDLARLQGIQVPKETIAIGTDWFLCYTETDYHVEILEWVSLDNENKIKQSIEMMHTLKQLLLKNKKKIFMASMRHDSSYAMYQKMLQQNYFKEICHRRVIDCAAPKAMDKIEAFSDLNTLLSSDIPDEYKEYLKYILHHMQFMITNKFTEKYEKKPKNKR